jgi:hypothetical protein
MTDPHTQTSTTGPTASPGSTNRRRDYHCPLANLAQPSGQQSQRTAPILRKPWAIRGLLGRGRIRVQIRGH